MIIDAAWDDPIPDGNEYHRYFGLNDERMSQTHTWAAADSPAATGTRYYQGVDNGQQNNRTTQNPHRSCNPLCGSFTLFS